MKAIIRDGFIGLFAILLAMVLIGGLNGYFNGLAMDGPDANFGWDGAFGTIILMLWVYGIPASAIGFFSGAVVGWVVRKIHAR